MKDSRPVNLNLLTIRMPITAYTSILHRLSGLLVFLAIPIFLWALQASLQSAQSFAGLQRCFGHWSMQGLVWLLTVGLVYHMIAGLRHLLMDMHIGHTRCGGIFGSWLVLGLAGAFALWFGFWMWG